jgi:hypothetical protein
VNMKKLISTHLVLAAVVLLGCSGGTTSTSDGGGAGAGGRGGSSVDAGGGESGASGGAAGAVSPSGNGGSAGKAGLSGNGGSAGKGNGGSTGGTIGTGGAAGTSPTGLAGSTGTAGSGQSAGAGGASGAAGGGPGGLGGTTVHTVLVDDDKSDNNGSVANPKSSPSDTIFPALLQNEGLSFRTLVSTTDSTPGYSDLEGYTNVVWYTGPSKQTLSADQQQALEQWLDIGGKRLVVFSECMTGNLGGGTWASEANQFLGTYVGAAGSASDVYSYVREDFLYDLTYVATGGAGTPFASMTFSIAKGSPIASTADVVNPASGTITLVTVSVDPTSAGGDSPTPVAVGHMKGTSTIVYVGLPIENITAPPMSTQQQFFHATLVYLGIAN